ncbi:hypothetical protein Tco_0891616 [Tanacetum coccineum]|uniref:Integrase, catalytic region, zinc finger, CCHC-type, peptidase aspartic, catalytic n=1 Tax=Tanacetum coccineum TaxID=301880 RepID=A0ABQ5C570_9ASTR
MTTLAEFMILSSGDNCPPMLEKALYDSWKSRMELTKKYVELSALEKIQADCDLKATNIILQGLPPDVYALINHHRVSKDLWERIQLLMQGTSLTKQERECKLYDEFDKFAHIKGELLHQYYLRFAQIINDMNIYKMKLEQFQVNTKFLNSLPPEWSKFVTDVKLVRDLHTTNFDQLNAYLEQHELHANEVLNQQTYLAEFPQIDSGLAVPVFKQGDDPIETINKMMSFLSIVVTSPQGSSKVLNEEELAFLADSGVAEGPVTQTVITHNAVYQADDLDAYDSDCDKISTVKAVLMANLSSYRSVVLSKDTNSSTQQDSMILYVFEQLSNQVPNCNKANKDNLIANESLSAELERYKERVKLLEERQNVDLSNREKLIEKESLTTTINVLKNESKEKEVKNIDKEIALEKKVKELDNFVYKMALGFQNPFYLKKAQQIRPMLYDCSIIANETNVISIADSEETLMLEEESQSKMLLKQNFGKRFVSQQELSDEQAFWLQTSHPNTDQSVSSPVKIEAPRELSKEHIKMMRENDKEEKIKHEMDEIKTINIEVEHSVAELLYENERLQKEIKHLKKIYKDQFDSIKKTRALSKEHGDSLIAQLNSKLMENVDLKHQLQDKLDLDPLATRLLQNWEAHIYYLKHTKEQADILRGIVEQTKAKHPSDNALDLACCYHTYEQGLKCSTSTCRSQPTANKKNDRISQKPSSNKKNKVEAQPKKVNKKNRVKEPICDDKAYYKLVRCGISNGLDMAYLGFLGVGTTFDIFQNLHILYFQYDVLVFSRYGVLSLLPSWSLVSAGTDTPYLPGWIRRIGS